MHIYVSEIPEIGIQKIFTTHLENKDFSSSGEVSVKLDITRSDQIVFITGSIKGEIVLTCSRCLESYPYNVDIALENCYVPLNEMSGEKEHELSKEELDVSFYSDDIIDVYEFLTEQILLSSPMRTLCHTDCKGLCSNCGQNLNLTSCQCKEEHIDPRLSVLAKLLKNT